MKNLGNIMKNLSKKCNPLEIKNQKKNQSQKTKKQDKYQQKVLAICINKIKWKSKKK